MPHAWRRKTAPSTKSRRSRPGRIFVSRKPPSTPSDAWTSDIAERKLSFSRSDIARGDGGAAARETKTHTGEPAVSHTSEFRIAGMTAVELVVDRVGKEYRQQGTAPVEVLRDVGFRVPAGGFAALIGP